MMMARMLGVGALAALVAVLAACGGGGGGGGGSPVPPVQNVLPIVVDKGLGPVANVNIPYVSVTICAPGSTTACQTVDHVILDTASTGLRILASVLDTSVNLPAQIDPSGASLAECMAFVDSYAWGTVRVADVRLAGQAAGAIPVQIIADPAYPTVPASCSSRGPVGIGTVRDFGANGILGVSTFVEDCGPTCVQAAVPGTYYACSGGACSPAAVGQDRQVRNPVAALPADNNGIVVDLPAVPAAGAVSVSGSLLLGIGTRGNNGLGGAAVFDLDSSGSLTAIFKGRTLGAFFDTGSNALFFPDGMPVCAANSAAPGFYCPASTQDLTAVVQGASRRTSGTVSFSVDNAATLAANGPTFVAFGNIAAPAPWAAVFDWGLPYFYGRRVFQAIEQRSTPAGTGPFVAF